ncbi:MAG: Na/Pi cotransporter family protein, partial [Deltaproteobacteria bacterium]|nr:Na/Pi cotransporter family protein [Deltaproteobacteria bacterium]
VGANLGTTLTVILGSLGGSAAKRQVAAAHFLFNLITDIVALATLPWLLDLIRQLFGSDRPLYSLVFFHSSFNLIGIVIFFPFLKPFARLLNKLFKDQEEDSFALIKNIDPKVPTAALLSSQTAAKDFIKKSLALNALALGLENHSLSTMDYLEKYRHFKQGEGLLLQKLIQLQAEPFSEEEAKHLEKILSSIHHTIRAVKDIKDIHHNLEEFKNTSQDSVYEFYQSTLVFLSRFYQELKELLEIKEPKLMREDLTTYLLEVEKEEVQFESKINQAIQASQVPAKYMISLFNLNREIYHANQALLLAIQDWASL